MLVKEASCVWVRSEFSTQFVPVMVDLTFDLFLLPRVWWVHYASKLRVSSTAAKNHPCNSHYNDVIIGAMASQIVSLTIVYLTVYSRRRSKKTSKLRVTGLCEGNSPVTGEFPAQGAINAENVSIWWRHHAYKGYHLFGVSVLNPAATMK